MRPEPTTGLQADAGPLIALVAIALVLGCLMVWLPLLQRWVG